MYYIKVEPNFPISINCKYTVPNICKISENYCKALYGFFGQMWLGIFVWDLFRYLCEQFCSKGKNLRREKNKFPEETQPVIDGTGSMSNDSENEFGQLTESV